jgi:hypothetical protein
VITKKAPLGSYDRNGAKLVVKVVHSKGFREFANICSGLANTPRKMTLKHLAAICKPKIWGFVNGEEI